MKPFSRTALPGLAVAAVTALVLAGCDAGPSQEELDAAKQQLASKKQEAVALAQEVSSLQEQLALRNAMRALWEEHVAWTRLAIVDFAEDSPSFNATAGRLLQNQVDIGNAIKPFYGDAAGDRLTGLLNDHILIAVDLLKAAKAGETAAFADAQARWNGNADEIAGFLSSANPQHWPQAEMKAMMSAHLALTLTEASAHLKGDWAGSVAAYDKTHDMILHMADMLSDGIVKQFPQKFL